MLLRLLYWRENKTISKRKRWYPYIPTLHWYHVRIKVFTFDILISRYCDTILYSTSNKTSILNAYRVYKEGRNWISYPISKVFFDIKVKTFDIEGGKEGLFGASSISYTISYTILMHIYDDEFLNRTECSAPPAVQWQQWRSRNGLWRSSWLWLHGPRYEGQFSIAYPGPIHQFLSGIPDWMNINQEDLYLALESLHIPLKGPIPPGISLQEAFQVNQRHNIHIRQHQNIILDSNWYTISYTNIVHHISITLLISYTLLDTI